MNTTELHIEPKDRHNWAIIETHEVQDEDSKKFGERVISHTKYFSNLESASRHAIDLGLRVGGLDSLIKQKKEILEGMGFRESN